MFFKCHVLYVDEGLIYDWSEEEREWNINLIQDFCKNNNFPFTIVPLERVFDGEELKETFEGI